eukprot:TRINITY_DN6789_c0_g1_i1.p1 TRINITY_DN6789_c0_g1~~TRINITY_DN6789_c0_g1_i1.p1  ORF type:complete len:1584 (+),score=427.97 TRINITY_DN6789_c0_g1_i1:53-4804(+)
MPPKKKPFQSPQQADIDQRPRREFGLLETPVPVFSEPSETVVACELCGNENPEGAETCGLCGGNIAGHSKPVQNDAFWLCPTCLYINNAKEPTCQLCRDSWQCLRCCSVQPSSSMECVKCNLRRPAGTLKGRVVEVSAQVEAEIDVHCDWPLFPEVSGWLERVSDSATIDTSSVAMPAELSLDLPHLEEGQTWPWRSTEESLTTLDIGDTVFTSQFDRGMTRQRCGWSTHMILFCGQEAVIKRILVNEDRAQLLLRFKHVELSDNDVPADRRAIGWFDYEWIKCPPGTKLPPPPGGWYEKLQRFPLTSGDTVRVKPYDPAMMNMKCGWDARMEGLAGKSATILRVLVTARFAQVHLDFITARPRTTSWWDIEWLDVSPSIGKKKYDTCTTNLCSGTVRISASNVRKCPHDHECRWVVNPYKARGGSVECESCHKDGIADEEVLHCELCDFDICKNCASGTRVLERTEQAVRALSTVVRVGDIPDEWLPLVTGKLQQLFGKVALKKCSLKDGRPAVLACVMGDLRGVVSLLEGQLFYKIHDGIRTVGGELVTNPTTKVDPGVLRAIELAYNCHVVAGETDTGTVALLGPREDRITAASKLVWYSSSRKVMIRIDPAERGVVQSKAVEIREKAKCHVSLEHGAAVKLIGLPEAVKATREAIQQLLSTHRHELQKARVDKAMSLVASELCEVRLTVPIAPALISVLSQLHEPNAGAATTKHGQSKSSVRVIEQVQMIRRRVQEELAEIHRAAKEELNALSIDASELVVPSNIAGVRAFHVGDLIVRGPDWEWDDQDGGAGQVGRVIDFPVRNEMDEGGLVNGTIAVEWPNRSRFMYSVGREQHCVHATQEGENIGDEGNDEEGVLQRVVRHKIAYIHLVNGVGTQEAQHAEILHSFEENKHSKMWEKSDMLQQQLHHTTRNKARVEYGANAISSSIDREEERSRTTLMRISSARAAGAIPEAHLQRAYDIMLQHLENLRGLRAKMHRQADSISMHLISRSARIRRVLADEIKRERFSGWDIIMSVMQATGALIEYRSGDDKLVLTGGEAAVHAAREKLRELTVRDLYAWSRVDGTITVSESGFRQLTRLQGLQVRIVEQVSGAESVTTEPPDIVRIKGTRPQIQKAVEVLQSRLGTEVSLTLATGEGRKGSETGSLVIDEVAVALDSECEVCFTDLDSANTLPILCGHTATCAECLKQWVDAKISERAPASCPSKDCRHTLTAGEYRALLKVTGDANGNANDYENIMAMEKLRPTVRQCYRCSEGFAVRSDEGDMVPIMCAECKALICPNSNCSEPAHFFLDCDEVVQRKKDMLLRRRKRLEQVAATERLEEVDRSLARLEEASQTQEVLKKEMDTAGETRPCPACGALVHKTGGCNSMTCKCERKFCHQCLQSNCELVESTGAKVPCDPDRLQERIESVLAVHKGNTLTVGWLCCDVCDRYPIPGDMKVFACANCVNWYVCGECEEAGQADGEHEGHPIVEISQTDEVQYEKVECMPGPAYTIDWEGILPPPCDVAADNLEPEPREPSMGGEARPSISIEPITPVSATLEPPIEREGFEAQMLNDAIVHAVVQRMLPDQPIPMNQ